ncbi:glutathione S-transferase [Mesorhizobium sp. J18]|uniref:glutathione S-transferase family protein n=1 Tax=Mesorhizobium sp. J18 TaxID=935263 RepID=UPI00119A330C|nr:glutathione S-transferase family protein [Mesorhizobium sp. J18]TWG93761.1 glutathione S-transferase [Mesorhizobium sp. J18]
MTIQLYDLVGSDTGRPFSPHCWKAAFALAHKGLDFKSIPTRFTEIPQVEEGVSRTVPVIRDGDSVVVDSFAIAEYLEDSYPERPSLFGGEGGRAAARFVERWALTQVHPFIVSAAVVDIHDMLDPKDQIYFRANREERFGKPLEEVIADRDAGLAGFRASLESLRNMLKFQPFIGGKKPLFTDYIVAGAFQWARIVTSYQFLAPDDPVAEWFDRCLDLHDGLARRIPAAA